MGVVRQMAEDPKKRKEDRPPEEIPLDEKGDDIVYSPVPSEIDEEPLKSSLPPEAPVSPKPREEREISKKGEERIAREQAE